MSKNQHALCAGAALLKGELDKFPTDGQIWALVAKKVVKLNYFSTKIFQLNF